MLQLKGANLVLVPTMVKDFKYQERFNKLKVVLLPLLHILVASVEHNADNLTNSSGLIYFDNLFA